MKKQDSGMCKTQVLKFVETIRFECERNNMFEATWKFGGATFEWHENWSTYALDGIWPCGRLQVSLRGNTRTTTHCKNLTWPRDCHIKSQFFFNFFLHFRNLINLFLIKILTSGTGLKWPYLCPNSI